MGSRSLIGSILGGQRRRLALGTTSGIVWMACLAALPVAVGRAIDAAIGAEASGVAGVWGDAAVVMVVVAVGAVAGAVRHTVAVTVWSGSRLMAESTLSDRVLDRRGGVDRPVGELLSLGIGDANKVGLVADILNRGGGAIAAIIVVAVWLLTTSWSLGLVILAGIPVAGAIVAPFMGSYDRRATAERAQLASATAAAADGVTGLRAAQGIGGSAALRRWFAERSEAMHRSALALVRMESLLFASVGLIPTLTLVPVLWLGGTQVLDGALSAGVLVAVLGLAQFMATPMFALGEMAQTVTAGRASARRIEDVLTVPTAVDEAARRPGSSTSTDHAAPDIGPALRLDRLITDALRDVSLSVERGVVFGIACGRSREVDDIAALLARHRPPVGGRVLVHGDDVAAVPLAELSSRLTVIDTERPWLLSASLLDNLRLVRPDATEAEARAALTAAAADELLRGPDPLDRMVGERGLHLSGGQRQRVAVAQGLLSSAEVVVLVEPSSALDAATEALMMGRVSARVAPERHRALVVLSTSPAVLADCDQVAAVIDGRVLAVGRHGELLADRRYRAVLGVGAP